MSFRILKKWEEKMERNHRIVIIGFLIAIQIILNRFLSIQTMIVRISFGFVPICITAILFGPFYAGVMAAIADILGMMIFPKGMYFPGFTVSAFITGLLYGIFLYRKNIKNMRIFCAVVVVGLFNLVVNSTWLMMLTGKAFIPIFLARIVQFIAMCVLSYFIIKYIAHKINFLKKITIQKTTI